MTDYLNLIDTRFPVRCSVEQKEEFRAWALAETERGGCPAAGETNEGHVNLVFGDPETARVIFTAHYDTPRRSLVPNLMLVSNRALYWAYNIGIALVMLAIAIGAVLAVKAMGGLDFHRFGDRMLLLGVYTAVYIALFAVVLRGPANRRNRNDNTSGTAAVMALTEALGGTGGAAFILFDNEEKGKKGSKAYARAHPQIRSGALVLNLDCVGNGDTFIFCASRKAEEDPLYAQIKNTLSRDGLNARFMSASRTEMNSDHKSFDRGVGLCACHYRPVIGFFTGRIHTARDTVADPQAIERLADALARAVGSAS